MIYRRLKIKSKQGNRIYVLQKTLVGADAPNPKNSKSSRPVPGAGAIGAQQGQTGAPGGSHGRAVGGFSAAASKLSQRGCGSTKGP